MNTNPARGMRDLLPLDVREVLDAHRRPVAVDDLLGEEVKGAGQPRAHVVNDALRTRRRVRRRGFGLCRHLAFDVRGNGLAPIIPATLHMVLRMVHDAHAVVVLRGHVDAGVAQRLERGQLAVLDRDHRKALA